jgi:hypothetical protein
VGIIGQGFEEFKIINIRLGMVGVAVEQQTDSFALVIIHHPATGFGKPDKLLGIRGGGGKLVKQGKWQVANYGWHLVFRTVLPQEGPQTDRLRRGDADAIRVGGPGHCPA